MGSKRRLYSNPRIRDDGLSSNRKWLIGFFGFLLVMFTLTSEKNVYDDSLPGTKLRGNVADVDQTPIVREEELKEPITLGNYEYDGKQGASVVESDHKVEPVVNDVLGPGEEPSKDDTPSKSTSKVDASADLYDDDVQVVQEGVHGDSKEETPEPATYDDDDTVVLTKQEETQPPTSAEIDDSESINLYDEGKQGARDKESDQENVEIVSYAAENNKETQKDATAKDDEINFYDVQEIEPAKENHSNSTTIQNTSNATNVANLNEYEDEDTQIAKLDEELFKIDSDIDKVLADIEHEIEKVSEDDQKNAP